MQTGFFWVLCNYIRVNTHLCIFWLWLYFLRLYFLSARVRALGSVSSLSVARRSILRALYLVHLWAFCSKGSTGCHIPAAECENRTRTDTQRLAVCHECYSELNKSVTVLVGGEGSKLVATGLQVNNSWGTLVWVSEPGISGLLFLKLPALEWFKEDCLMKCLEFNFGVYSEEPGC